MGVFLHLSNFLFLFLFVFLLLAILLTGHITYQIFIILAFTLTKGTEFSRHFSLIILHAKHTELREFP